MPGIMPTPVPEAPDIGPQAEAESNLVWSAMTCSAKCAEMADAYRDLDFASVKRAERELRAEQGRLAEARIKSEAFKREGSK